MKYPISWLRQYVNPTLDNNALANLLTMSGLEVEAIESYGNADQHIVIGEIIEINAHPKADQLKICRINIHQDIPTDLSRLLDVVCAAPNVAVGMKVPFAQVGARIQEQIIEAKNFHGIASCGMLLSAHELDIGEITEETGILALPDDAPVGTLLADYLPISDTLLTIKLTPNRGDCLSIQGMAREISALAHTPLILPFLSSPENNERQPSALAIELNAEESCPMYCGCEITDLPSADEQTILKTPLWMKIRLAQCGERPIHPLVDITNFVMLECGQPLHAFDRTKLKGPIGVRYSRTDESLTLLNQQSVTLDEQCLVITDADRPVAMAGVMGGLDTMINANSTSVFFEAAHFIPSAVNGRSRRFGIASEAAYRFERGVDTILPPIAINRAVQLTLDIVGGCASLVNIAHFQNDTQSKIKKRFNSTVPFSLSRAQALIGYPYTAKESEQALDRLGFHLEKADKEPADHYWVSVPSWRFDILLEEDVIEEVARLVGYDEVAEIMPETTMTLEDTAHAQHFQRTPLETAYNLAAHGYRETQHFAFIADHTDRRFSAHGNSTNRSDSYQPIVLANPISENLNVMRSQLMGTLVENCATQARHHERSLKIFELARVFHFNTAEKHNDAQERDSIQSSRGYYEQPYHLAMLMWGEEAPLQWGKTSRGVDFYDLKGDFESILQSEGGDISALEWQACTAEHSHPALHPSRSAYLRYNHQTIGWIGELHPNVVHHYHLSSPPMVLECDWFAITQHPSITYSPINRTPVVERDLSLLMPTSYEVGPILHRLQASEIDYIKYMCVFDVYLGNEHDHVLSADQKSVTFRFYLQADAHTLSEAIISQQMQRIIQCVQTYGDITVR